jgi:RCC1 and BTB domain-containing protein
MYGKLGHGNESGSAVPKRVESLAQVPMLNIACGSRHTVAISTDGHVYTWGDREQGVSGHGETEGHQLVPRLVERLATKRVIQVSACGFHTGK